MSLDKHIAVIGVSDEETAHLRLLIRKAAGELSHRWQWGSETGADLLIVDPSTFSGQMARTRALSGGMRCAVFTDEDGDGEDLVLRRPLRLANVVDVLNDAASGIARPAGIVPQKWDFYFGEHDVAQSPEASPYESAAPAKTEAAAPGLEDLIRSDAEDRAAAREVDVRLDDGTTVFGTSGPTARSSTRVRDTPELFARRESDVPGPRRVVDADMERHSLRAFLDGELLGGPARIALPEAPPLVLDPKMHAYHSPGRLAELEPYCRTALRRHDWQPLTTLELAELRRSQPAQPYQRLVWLYVLVHSEGRLASHLDPGGTYRLLHWIEIERDFRSYFRIASTLLQPARLHEVAAQSEAPMAEVFDVVNAYDAIGLIECTRRPPRGGEEPPPKAQPGLLQRLKRPFGKS